MEPGLVASYALAIGGLAMVAWSGWLLNTANVNHKIGNPALQRLFKANNPSRAGKLCACAPFSYFTAVGAAIEVALATTSRDRVTLAAVIDPAFTAKADEIIARWRRVLERAVLGGAVTLTGVGLAISDRFVPVPLYIAGGITVVALAWLGLRRNSLSVSLEVARLELLPALISSIVHVPAPAAAGPSPSPVAVPAPKVTSPVTPVSSADPVGVNSLRSGRCPLCEHTTISRVEGADERFHTLVCRGCGHAQQFADLTKLD